MSGKAHSLLGTSAMTAASFLRAVIQVTVLPVIGRLLGPQVYGEVALVTPFIFFAMMLAESGLGACVVRAQERSHALEGTVFCFSALFSLAVMALFALAAYPLGHLLHEPHFPPLLLGMSCILLLASLNIVPAALLLREKRYGWIALSDVVSSLCSLIGVGAGIWLDWGAWSLVAQQLGLWFGKVAIVVIGARWHPRLIFSAPLFRQNIYFGSNLTGANILAFLARNIDNVLIGSMIGTEALGYYALAFQIIGLPGAVLSGSVYYTVFAGISEAQRLNQHTAAHFLKPLRGLFLLVMPSMVGIAATAPLSVPLLLGDKWLPIVRLIQLLSPLGVIVTMGAVNSGVFIGLGKSNLLLRLGFMSSVPTILAIIAGSFFSSDAVAIGVSLTAVASGVNAARIVAREAGTTLGAIGQTLLAPLVSSLLMGGAVYVFGRVLPMDWPLALRLGLSIGFGALVYAAALFGLFRDHVAGDAAALRNALRSRFSPKQVAP